MYWGTANPCKAYLGRAGSEGEENYVQCTEQDHDVKPNLAPTGMTGGRKVAQFTTASFGGTNRPKRRAICRTFV
jgi:hypothetical protein